MRRDDVMVAIAFIAFAAFFFMKLTSAVQQQHDCEAACGPAEAITPIVGGRNVCLCDEGHGKWRRVNLISG
jgi:hypothetical protein